MGRAVTEALGDNMSRVLAIVLALMASGLAYSETLEYSIFAIKSAERSLIAQNILEYRPTRVKTIKRRSKNGEILWSKSLQLEQGFSISADYRREKDVLGFGLTVESRKSPLGFSWEWFNLEKDDIFDKLKGVGKVKVVLKAVGDVKEIAAIEFLDDIELHFRADFPFVSNDITHIVVVKKGSILRVVA